jgi:hypothetical protein
MLRTMKRRWLGGIFSSKSERSRTSANGRRTESFAAYLARSYETTAFTDVPAVASIVVDNLDAADDGSTVTPANDGGSTFIAGHPESETGAEICSFARSSSASLQVILGSYRE